MLTKCQRLLLLGAAGEHLCAHKIPTLTFKAMLDLPVTCLQPHLVPSSPALTCSPTRGHLLPCEGLLHMLLPLSRSLSHHLPTLSLSSSLLDTASSEKSDRPRSAPPSNPLIRPLYLTTRSEDLGFDGGSGRQERGLLCSVLCPRDLRRVDLSKCSLNY